MVSFLCKTDILAKTFKFLWSHTFNKKGFPTRTTRCCLVLVLYLYLLCFAYMYLLYVSEINIIINNINNNIGEFLFILNSREQVPCWFWREEKTLQLHVNKTTAGVCCGKFYQPDNKVVPIQYRRFWRYIHYVYIYIYILLVRRKEGKSTHFSLESWPECDQQKKNHNKYVNSSKRNERSPLALDGSLPWDASDAAALQLQCAAALSARTGGRVSEEWRSRKAKNLRDTWHHTAGKLFPSGS